MTSSIDNLVMGFHRTHDDIVLMGHWHPTDHRILISRSEDMGRSWSHVYVLEDTNGHPRGFGESTSDPDLYYFGMSPEYIYPDFFNRTGWYNTRNNEGGVITWSTQSYSGWSYSTLTESPYRVGDVLYAGLVPNVNGTITGLDIGYSVDNGETFSTGYEWHNGRIYRDYLWPWHLTPAYDVASNKLWYANWNPNIVGSSIVYNSAPDTNPTNWTQWTFDCEHLAGIIPAQTFNIIINSDGVPSLFCAKADIVQDGNLYPCLFALKDNGLYDVWTTPSADASMDIVLSGMDFRNDPFTTGAHKRLFATMQYGTYGDYNCYTAEASDNTIELNGVSIKTLQSIKLIPGANPRPGLMINSI